MVIIILGAYVFVSLIGHLFVRGILRQYQLPELPEPGLKGAGATIGVLERILVLTLVLVGQYATIAVIFAAKSITRFEELKHRKFAEYYLIGTLLSILFSIITGIFVKQLLICTSVKQFFNC
ncbi:MAG: hypothetical protein PHX21_11475 [bacterium]|nr:hypothetical protein [bacterium]